MTRVAVVDLGTNSTRLLVADVAGDSLQELERRLTITRLGEGVDADRLLLPTAVARVRACLAGYRRLADELGADRAVAVATSAVRDAKNGIEFLEGIARDFGFEPRLVTGDEEALLTLRGVTAGRRLDGPVLVVDVGGGSTELVVGSADRTLFHASLDIGCVRLTERFLASDPPTPDELTRCAAHVRTLVSERLPERHRAREAIGVAGTVTALATLHLGLEEEDPRRIHRHRLPVTWIAEELARLAARPVSELAALRGLHPGRASVIVGGVIALLETLRVAGAEELEVSVEDLLHGAALEAARTA